MTAQSAVVGTEPRLSRLYRANDGTEAREEKMQSRRDQEVPTRISDSGALRCPSSISTGASSVDGVQQRHPDGAPSSTDRLMLVTRRPRIGSRKGESKSFQEHISALSLPPGAAAGHGPPKQRWKSRISKQRRRCTASRIRTRN